MSEQMLEANETRRLILDTLVRQEAKLDALLEQMADTKTRISLVEAQNNKERVNQVEERVAIMEKERAKVGGMMIGASAAVSALVGYFSKYFSGGGG